MKAPIVMTTPTRLSQPSLHLTGRGTVGYLIALALGSVGIAVIAANPLAITFLLPIFAGGTALFLCIGYVHQHTVLEVYPDRLLEKVWKKTITIMFVDVTAVGLRTSQQGRSVRRSIVWWHEQRQVAEIQLEPYPIGSFCDFLLELHRRQPQLLFDRELDYYLQTHAVGTVFE